MRNYHQQRIFPFPIVTGREDCDAAGFHKLKVTKDTAFHLLRASDAPCRVTVAARSSKRVRLDGLYVQSPSAGYLHHILHSQANEAQRRFAERALDTRCGRRVTHTR